jgi:hypothetical protein
VNRRSAAMLFAGLLALCVAGCAAWAAKQYERKVAATRAALIAAGDADSLAAAGLLGDAPITAALIAAGHGDLRAEAGLNDALENAAASRLALITRAAEEAPDRPDLTWLRLQSCTQVKSCNPEPIADHLRAVDPTNAAAWIGVIADRSERQDPEQTRTALLAIANTDRFDVYWNPLIVNTANAIIKTKTMDSATALVAVLGMVTAQTIPPYGPLFHACKGPSLQQADIVAACRRVSTVLRRGDTYITELIGIAIAMRVWPERSTEYQDAVEARRTAHYRMETEANLSLREKWDDAYAERYIRLLATHHTEQEAALEQIVSAGINPNPSADWKDQR